MPSAIYIIQIHDGYTDGKPSWRRVFAGMRSAITKETAELAVVELQKKNPTRKYRVRKGSVVAAVGASEQRVP